MYEIFLLIFFISIFLIDRFKFINSFLFIIYTLTWIMDDAGILSVMGFDEITLKVVTLICIVLLGITYIASHGIEYREKNRW